MSNSKNEDFDFKKIAIAIFVIFCLFKISECRKHEIARGIMKDKAFREENNIRNYEDAEEAADLMMDEE